MRGGEGVVDTESVGGGWFDERCVGRVARVYVA